MDITLRLAGVIKESVVDGPGWRFVVFAQGCPHHCPGCHNPETHDFQGGYESTIDKLLAEIRKNPLLKGITLSGGEPFSQAANFAALAEAVRNLGLDVITYTGWTLEQLLAGQAENPGWQALLEASDVLIDGPYDAAQRTLGLPFRGSRNQRILDVKASLAAGYALETAFA